MPGNDSNTKVHILPPRQRGAVLVIGLLILLVMTLIGVTAMSTSTMQERMSANGMNANIAFQAAESAVIAAMSSLATVKSAMGTVGPVNGPTVTYGSGSLTAVGNSQVTYVGDSIPDGTSLGIGTSGLTAHQFTASSTSTVTAANARSATNQGWVFIGPK